MTIVNPITTSTLVPQAQPTPTQTSEERQIDLRPEQIIRATVVEGGLDKTLLEMNHQHFRAQSEVELQAGQKLTLQVLQTHPRLEFRVLNNPLDGKLSQLLPLLTRSYDWAQLLKTMQQQSQPGQLPSAMTQVFSQLQALLQPLGGSQENLQGEISRLAAQLQQLFESPGFVINSPSSAQSVSGSLPAAVSLLPAEQLNALAAQIVQGLQAQLDQGSKGSSQSVPQQAQVALRELTESLPPHFEAFSRLPLSQQSTLLTLLDSVRQQPNLPSPLADDLKLLAEQLILSRQDSVMQGGQNVTESTAAKPSQVTFSQQPSLPTSAESAAPPAAPTQAAPSQAAPSQATPSQATPTPAAPSQAASTPAAPTPAAPTPAAPTPAAPSPAAPTQAAPTQAAPTQAATIGVGSLQDLQQQSSALQVPATATPPPAEVVEGISQLLSQVRQLQEEKGGLTSDLTGRLEGLLDKLQQLSQPAEASYAALPELAAIATQLSQITQQAGIHPEGGQLGFLSQFFGFHLETELLNGKKKDALASLKLGLLSLRNELGEQAKEPLHRLEILQMCKSKLHEQQVQFLPLPFNELEEGYVLVEKQREQDAEDGAEAPLQLSLSLRLSALGNLRIDMLYEKHGLHLRVACEDQEKMRYLQDFREELEQAIETVPLQGVSFAADAQAPARQLLKRLLPEAAGMLDARI